jgi:hypothetical protein
MDTTPTGATKQVNGRLSTARESALALEIVKLRRGYKQRVLARHEDWFGQDQRQRLEEELQAML